VAKTSRPGIYSRPNAQGKTVYDATASHGGKQRQKRGFKTIVLAREWQAATLLKMQKGEVATPARLTLHSFIYDTWWPQHKAGLQSKETIRSYESYLRRLDEFMGAARLADLSRAAVTSFKAKMIRVEVPQAMASQVFTMLKMVLGYAVAEGFIASDPSYKVQKPRSGTAPRPTLSTATILNILEAAGDTWYGPLIHFTCLTGLRWKEVTGLEWRDIDFSAAEAQVRRVTTKSDAGSRGVALGPETLAGLQAHRLEQMRYFTDLGVSLPTLVFTTKLGAQLNRGNFHHSFWKSFRDELHLPSLHFHDLRHAQSTLSARAGVDPAVTQRRLGHADIRMTLGTYSHVTREDQAEAAETVEKYLNYQRLSRQAIEGGS
jgi:integrase